MGEGGGRFWERRGWSRSSSTHGPAAAASWPSGQRRKTNGGARASVREREGGRWAGSSRPGGQGPRGVGEGWPAGPVEGEPGRGEDGEAGRGEEGEAGRPKAKVQAARPKS
jgi:hypothetical protein